WGFYFVSNPPTPVKKVDCQLECPNCRSRILRRFEPLLPLPLLPEPTSPPVLNTSTPVQISPTMSPAIPLPEPHLFTNRLDECFQAVYSIPLMWSWPTSNFQVPLEFPTQTCAKLTPSECEKIVQMLFSQAERRLDYLHQVVHLTHVSSSPATSASSSSSATSSSSLSATSSSSSATSSSSSATSSSSSATSSSSSAISSLAPVFSIQAWQNQDRQWFEAVTTPVQRDEIHARLGTTEDQACNPYHGVTDIDTRREFVADPVGFLRTQLKKCQDQPSGLEKLVDSPWLTAQERLLVTRRLACEGVHRQQFMSLWWLMSMNGIQIFEAWMEQERLALVSQLNNTPFLPGLDKAYWCEETLDTRA